MSGVGRRLCRAVLRWHTGSDSERVGRVIVVAALGFAALFVAVAGGAGSPQPYTAYESAVSADTPVAQYRFDDASGSKTLADSAGTRTATNTSITLGAAGPFNGAHQGALAGSAYATLPSSPLAGATAFTVEGWVYWTGGTSYAQSMFDLGSSTTNYMYLTPASTPTNHPMLFEIHTTAGKVFQVSASTLASKAWQYVTVTENSGTLTLYLNGKQVGQTTSVTINPSSLGTMTNNWLGKSHISSNPNFNGSQSNFAFYTKALSASQVLNHYNQANFPVNSALPTVSGTAKDGQTLTAATGTWTGLTPITYTYQWNRCNSSGANCVSISGATAATYKATSADVGSTLQAAVTATNTAGNGIASSAATAVVAASTPANTVLPAISGTAKDGQLLSASTGTWTGTPTISYVYQWQTCNTSGASCTSISGATSSTYRLVTSRVGSTIRVVVTASNSAGTASATAAQTATVTNGPPVSTAAPAISGTVRDGQTLAANTGTWAGTAPISYAYQWQTCNSSGTGCSNLAGATSSTYALTASNVGNTLQVIVTATNAQGSAGATSAISTVVAAQAPANTAVPAISGTAQAGQSLSATNGAWTGTPPLSYTYQWQSCDSSGANCQSITGATSPSHQVTSADVGHTLKVAVAATNSAGSANATSIATGVVSAVAPANTAGPSIIGTAQQGQTLTANNGSWSGTTPLTYTYQWQRCDTSGNNCAAITGATTASYTLASADVGSTIRVAVTVTNPGGSATAASPPSATVSPSVPTNTTLPSISGTTQDGQTLTANPGSWAGITPFSYAYQWQTCDNTGATCTNISGATNPTYQLPSSTVGSTLRVVVTATNTAGTGNATSAATSLVVPLAPTNTSAPTISGTPQDGHTLTAANGSWSGTPPLTYTYQWQSCNSLGSTCTNLSGATAATYSVGPADVGNTVRVSVTATNSAGAGTTASGATAVITAVAPSNTTVPAISGVAKDSQTLTSSSGSWAGTAPFTYAYQWQRCDTSGNNCANITSATTSSYTVTPADVASTLRVSVTATNSAGSASSTTGQTTVVSANPPTNTLAPVTSGSAQSGQTLSVTSGTWSGTAPISYSYQWEACDTNGANCTPESGATASTYTASAADAGHTLLALVTATNAGGSIQAAATATGLVQPQGETGCTDIWTGQAGDTQWQTPTNWSSASAPSATDTACIPTGDSVNVTAGTNQAGVLLDQGTLTINGGSLSLNGPGASSVQSLTETSGTLTGAANVTVAASLAWSGGTMSGSGQTTVAALASAAIDAGQIGQAYLDTRTLHNQGTLTLVSGTLYGINNPQLINDGTFAVNAESAIYNSGLQGAGQVVNHGTLGKMAGMGTGHISWPIDNESQVSATSGQLLFVAGGTSGQTTAGSWAASPGASVVFAGSTPFALGATVAVSGDVAVTSGSVSAGVIQGSTADVSVTGATLQVDGSTPSTVRSLAVSGTNGVLTGSSEIDVSATFSASDYATLSGTGSTVIQAGAAATFNLPGSRAVYVAQRTIVNKGQLSLPNGGVIGSTNPRISNLGTLSINAENTGNNEGLVGSGQLTNQGVLQKTSGSGATPVAWSVDNESQVSATSGQLQFIGGGTSGQTTTGSWAASPGASVVFAGSTPFALGATAPMSGSVAVTSGRVAAGVIQGAAASISVTGGTLEVDGTAPSPVQTLSVSGSSGVLTGTGEIDISTGLWASDNATLSGSGSTVIKTGATGTFHQNDTRTITIDQRTIVNQGLLSLPTGGIVGTNARIDNLGTFTLNSETTGNNEGLIGTGQLTNQGTLQKTAGSGVTPIAWSVDNESQINADSGQLQFDGGGTSGQLTPGTWAASPGASIGLDGQNATYALGATATLQGQITQGGDITAGQINAQTADLTVQFGNLTLTGLSTSKLDGLTLLAETPNYINRETVSVSSELDISGSLSVQGNDADLAGAGTFVLTSSATGSLSASAWDHIDASAFVNEGTLNWTTGGLATNNTSMQLVNLGIFHMTADPNNAVMQGCTVTYPHVVTCPTFANYGTVTASFTTVPLQVTWHIVNYGNFNVPCQTYAFVPYQGWKTAPYCGADAGAGGAYDSTFKGIYFWQEDVFDDESNSADQQWGGGNNAQPNKVITGDAVNDATGNLTQSQTDINVGGRGLGLNLTRTYNAQAAATQTAPGGFGYGWSSTFTDHLIVTPSTGPSSPTSIVVVQPDGSRIPFYQGPSGAFASGPQTQAKLVQNPGGGFTYTLPTNAAMTFDATGRLTSEADRNANTTSLAYNGQGQLTTISDASGRAITFTYNGNSEIATATDPAGETLSYSYDAAHNLTSVTYAGDSAPRWQFAYDASHRLTGLTDGNGNATAFTYDGSQRVTSRRDPLGRTTTWSYDTASNGDAETKVTNPNGSITAELFQSSQAVQVTDAYGTSGASTQILTYTPTGALAAKTDGNGHATSYTYDLAGNKTSQTDAAGDATLWTYNASHDVTSRTTPKGEKTTLTLDSHGNVRSESRPTPQGTQTTSYGYDGGGDMTSKTDPLNNIWTYAYDSQGNRTTQIDPLGNTTTWTYDADSRQLTTTTPRGNVAGANPATYTTTYTLDQRGRIAQSQDGLGQSTAYGYDGNDNKTDTTDPSGNHTHTSYDADNEAIQVTNADRSSQATGYDAAGQPISQSDGNGHTTTYGRDLLEHTTSITDALNRTTTKTYDAAGNLASVTDPNGQTTAYAYDTANRMTSATYSDRSTPNVAYTYDGDSTRTTMTDGTGTTTYTYDALNRLTQTTNGHGATTGYVYDLAGNQTAVTYPNGHTIQRGFDANERLSSVTDWLGNITQFAYDPNSNVRTTTFPAPASNIDQYTYDGADQMTGITLSSAQGASLASLTYTRNGAGQVTSETPQGLSGTPQAYTYNSRRQLTQAGGQSYAYDQASNPTTINGQDATYDTANQQQKVGASVYSYDQRGARTQATPTSGPATNYSYNQAGDMISVTRGDAQPLNDTYTYNGDGLRASKTDSSGNTTQFSWDLSDKLPQLLSDGQYSYLYGPNNLPIEQVSADGTVFFFHHDQLGSTRMLTDASGNAVASFAYDPYGKLSSSSGAITTSLGWTGQYSDSDTGLVYLRARYYDPAAGEFLTVDPANAQTLQPYTYATDDPENNTDPTGLMTASQFAHQFTHTFRNIRQWGVNHHVNMDLYDEFAMCSFWATLFNLTSDPTLQARYQTSWQQEYARVYAHVYSVFAPLYTTLDNPKSPYVILKALVSVASRAFGY